MKLLLTLKFVFVLSQIEINAKCNAMLMQRSREWTDIPVNGYHFHSYFNQNNVHSVNEAKRLRNTVEHRIHGGEFSNCLVGPLVYLPQGVHPLGNFLTCCNKTKLPEAVSFFMQNHGNLTVHIHGLTRNNLADVSERVAFLGNVVPPDLTRYALSKNAKRVYECIPKDLN